MKIFLRIVAGLVALIAVLALGVYAWGQPIQQIPGRRLRGNEVTQPVTDWSFVNRVGLCEVEVNPDSPHSVTVGCYGAPQYLYVSHTIIPGARKSWAEILMDNPNARVKFDDNVYPVKATRIYDPAERQKVATERRGASPRRGPTLMGRIISFFNNPGAGARPSMEATTPPDNLWLYKMESR